MPRTSARVKAKRESANYYNDSSPSSEAEEIAPKQQRRPPRKRTKVEAEDSSKPVGRVPKNVKKKSHISQLPDDMFYEVAQYLDPWDILRLSFTCVALRATMMNHVLPKVIKKLNSLKERPLPPCPKDISLHRFVRLVFNKSCMMPGCKSSNARALWEYRARVCGKCMKNTNRFLVKNFEYIRDDKLFLPFYPGPAKKGYVLRADWELLQNKLRKYKVHSDSWTKAAIERLEWMHDRTQGADNLEYWTRRHVSEKEEDIEDIAEMKEQMLLRNIKEEGWDLELTLLSEEVVNNILRPYLKKDSIALVWEKIRPQLNKKMEQARKERLANECLERMGQRMDVLFDRVGAWKLTVKTNQQYLPWYLDFLDVEPFKTIIFSESIESDPIIEETEKLDTQIEVCARELHKQRQRCLRDLLPEDLKASSLMEIKESYDMEDFTGVAFRCDCSDEILPYCKALSHHCVKEATWVAARATHKWVDILGTCYDHCIGLPWNLMSGLKFEGSLLRVLTLCGEKPEPLSVTQFDKKNHIVACQHCDTNYAYSCWSSIQRHVIVNSSQRKCDGSQFIVVSEKECCRKQCNRDAGTHFHPGPQP